MADSTIEQIGTTYTHYIDDYPVYTVTIMIMITPSVNCEVICRIRLQ